MDPRDYPEAYLPQELLERLAAEENKPTEALEQPPAPVPPAPQALEQNPPPQIGSFATYELPGTSKQAPEPVQPASTPQAPTYAEQAPKPAATSANISQPAAALPAVHTAPQGTTIPSPLVQKAKNIAVRSKSSLEKIRQTDKTELRKRLKPFIGALVAGALIFGVFNSQVILGQFQYLLGPDNQPVTPAAISTTEKVSAEPLVIIPKINLSAPVVYDEPSFDEQAIQKALERGVVHYGSTALPGQPGNNVIVGHSSNNWWATGKYKFAFVLLSKLEIGDTFSLHYNSTRYTYEIFDKRIIEPNDLSVLSQNSKEPIATLITCDPPGTSWKRLIVVGKQISPDPASLVSASTQDSPQSLDSPLPGYGESFWQKLNNWLFN